MVPQTPPARTFEESYVLWSVGLTYVFYAAGALYVAGPVIAWLMMGIVLWRYLTDDPRFRLPGVAVWIWWIAMLVILFGLLIGHFNNGLGLGQTIKSTIGWAKGWAMFAVLLTAGACLNIRLQALARAANILGLQTVILTPILMAAPHIGLPPEIWISPLKAVGGPGPEFFTFRLYSVTPDGGYRWAFFAPWAPGAGIAAIVLFSHGVWDRDWRWRVVGLVGAALIAALVQSRLAMVGLPMVMIASYFLCRINRPWLLFSGAAAALLCGLGWGILMELASDAKAAMDAYRPGSTRVRGTLQAIAQHRFSDNPVFGHGIQGKGTHLVEFMPIGSHHTWNGLLFVKGLLGVAAFAVAMVWATVEMIWRGQRSDIAMAGLACLLAMWLYSFGENLEVLVYLFWPGLIAAGRALASPRAPPPMPAHR